MHPICPLLLFILVVIGTIKAVQFTTRAFRQPPPPTDECDDPWLDVYAIDRFVIDGDFTDEFL